MKIEMGGKYIRRCDLDSQGNVKPDAKKVEILTTTVDANYSVLYQFDAQVYGVTCGGFTSSSGSLSYGDLLPYPEPTKLVPWDSIDEIPESSIFKLSKLAGFRLANEDCMFTIIAYEISQVRFYIGWYTLKNLLDFATFSIDRGKTWQLCGKRKHA